MSGGVVPGMRRRGDEVDVWTRRGGRRGEGEEVEVDDRQTADSTHVHAHTWRRRVMREWSGGDEAVRGCGRNGSALWGQESGGQRKMKGKRERERGRVGWWSERGDRGVERGEAVMEWWLWSTVDGCGGSIDETPLR